MASTTTTNIMEQVKEMKDICVDGVALSGMVAAESMGEKFDQMHHTIKRKIDDIDLSVGNLDSDVEEINTMMERV